MDVLESFIAVRAALPQAWPFITHVAKIAMWTSPLVEPVAGQGERVLDAGDAFDLVLGLPGRPRLSCLVLSLDGGAVEVKLDGFVRGFATWRLVPAGQGVIAHARCKYDLADRRWLVPWAFAGRWGAALVLKWLLRRFKARIEDTVGSSRFGLPLLVSPYAVVGVIALVGVCLCLVGMRVARLFRPQVDRDG